MLSLLYGGIGVNINNADLMDPQLGGCVNEPDMISGRTVNIDGGNFVQHNHCTQVVNSTKEGQRLLADSASPNASHNSGHNFDPPKCHPNTRVAVQNKIKNWIQWKEDSSSPIMWLYGGAGAGKSTIARTIAEWCEEKNILLSSFFFWRSDQTRNHIKTFLATIAYDIARCIPETRQLIELVVEEDRHIFSRNLEFQFTKLVYEPFMAVSQTLTTTSLLPHVIIVDGLDECLNQGEQEALLRLFSSIFQRYDHLHWRVLVASRKEQTISLMFDDKLFSRTTALLALNDDYAPRDDIRRFFKDKTAEIKLRHPLRQYIPSNWPCQTDIEELVEKSSGHFIFAAIVIRYIESRRHIPPARLKLVMNSGSPGSSVAHGLPFAELDLLYTHIFSSIEVEKAYLAPRLVAFIIMITRQTHYFGDFTMIETCGYGLGIPREEVEIILGELGSIVELEDFGYYRVLHASLEDFLFDSHRSRQVWVDRNLVWVNMLRYALRVHRCLEVVESCTCDFLGKIRLTPDSYRHFVEVIDFGSLSQFCSHCSSGGKSALDKSCDIFRYYLNYLKTEVTHLDSGKRYQHQVSTVYCWLIKHYPRITWGCLLHLVTNTSPNSCFRIYSSGSWSSKVAFQDCLLYGFQVPPDQHTFERVSTLLAQYNGVDGLLTQKQQIASVALHLIRYLGIKGHLHEGASLYINGNGESRRKSRPWLWRVRTFRRRACHLMEPLDEMYEVSWDRLNHPAFTTWRSYRGYLTKRRKVHIGTQLLAFCYSTRSALKALPKMLYHSPKTPEIMSILSSGLIFHRIAFFFPKELRIAKLAIDRYLGKTARLPNRL